MKIEEAEIDIFSIDWASLPEEDKVAIISEHVHYINLSRKLVNIKGYHSANFRTLFLMLTMGLVMSLLGLENKSIILSMIAVQLFRTIISQLFEASLSTALKIAKKDLASFINRKTQTR